MPGKLRDITGERFNRLVATRYSHRDKARALTFWFYRCDCGAECLLPTHSVRNGNTKSCGCFAREVWGQLAKNHPAPILDKTGQRFGRWLVVSLSHRDKAKRATYWRCRCDCGTESVIAGDRLPKTHSCGCFRAEQLRERATTHGFARRGERGGKNSLYTTWSNMKARCYRPSAGRYANYGGRGVVACQRWREDFGAFKDDVGDKPEGMSLDRIEVNGHYSCGSCEECVSRGWPRNVRWATAAQQYNNKTTSANLTVGGVSRTIAEWAAETGLSVVAIWNRYNVHGWSAERSVTTPLPKKRHESELHRLKAIRRTMIHRCTSSRNKSYPKYGGRGITVCARWLQSFANFHADIGDRPTPAHSVDRINNDGGYWCGKAECPECGPAGRSPNCRWATAKEQTANRGKRRRTQRRDYTCISQ